MPIPARHQALYETGCFYHVYNRGIAGIQLFAGDRNRMYFLKKFADYLSPILHVYAWCLLPNPFHFLVEKMGNEQQLTDQEKTKLHKHEFGVDEIVSMRFKNFFIAYSLAYKKEQQINTNVFAQKYKHIKIDRDAYFSQLIYYIHLNPLHHKVCLQWQDYPWSSYHKIRNNSPSYVKAKEVLDWFGGMAAFEKYHLLQQENYICEFDV